MRTFLAIVFTLLTPLAIAADLTTKEVEKWIKESPALQQWVQQNEEALDEVDDEEEPTFEADKLIERSIKKLKDAKLYDQLNARVRNAGYKSVEDWVDLSQRISVSYLGVMLETQTNTRKEIEAQLAQLKTMKMPAEQKEMMENMLKSSLNMLTSVEKASAADKNAVRPYMQKLTEIYDDRGDDAGSKFGN